MRVAIIQPYFFPYAGYFRLFNLTDLFVVFDCVQFPRRGWVHRNRIQMPSLHEQWLTLPLQKQPRETAIKDLTFHCNFKQEWPKKLSRLEWLINRQANPDLYDWIYNISNPPIKVLVEGLNLVCQELSISSNVIRSSSLEINPELKGQDRVIDICNKLGAKEYLNASGGRLLYNKTVFKKHDIKLQFLNDYQGGHQSILQRLLTEKKAAILSEINTADNREILLP